ncbi:MAG: MBL fold metallo-hydrolase, partial [Gemmataceae bacterium]|nr:MBL fold metallo-hydrolase [Gemmataceae bacterium]
MSRIDLSVPLGAHGPSTYTPPALNPTGVTHERVEVAPGVHALVSSRPPVDNSSFVVGEHAVLVVDSNINGEMGRRIQACVREVTDLPIRFLVNTNHFGDHSFGNYTFPKETIVVGQRETARGMRDLEQQKHFLSLCVGDTSVYGDLQLRLPDVVFDNYLQLDLGGKLVELYHFGPGSTLGDTIVYEPAGRVVWTGNLVSGGWSIPLLLE